MLLICTQDFQGHNYYYFFAEMEIHLQKATAESAENQTANIIAAQSADSKVQIGDPSLKTQGHTH